MARPGTEGITLPIMTAIINPTNPDGIAPGQGQWIETPTGVIPLAPCPGLVRHLGVDETCAPHPLVDALPVRRTPPAALACAAIAMAIG